MAGENEGPVFDPPPPVPSVRSLPKAAKPMPRLPLMPDERMERKVRKLLEADLSVNGKITKHTYTVIHKYNDEGGHRPYKVVIEVSEYKGDTTYHFAVFAPNPPVQHQNIRASTLSVENLEE